MHPDIQQHWSSTGFPCPRNFEFGADVPVAPVQRLLSRYWSHQRCRYKLCYLEHCQCSKSSKLVVSCRLTLLAKIFNAMYADGTCPSTTAADGTVTRGSCPDAYGMVLGMFPVCCILPALIVFCIRNLAHLFLPRNLHVICGTTNAQEDLPTNGDGNGHPHDWSVPHRLVGDSQLGRRLQRLPESADVWLL